MSISGSQAASGAEEKKVSQRYLTKLRRILVKRLDEDELRKLCFDLSIDYDDLPGEEKANKARKLVSLCDRRNRVHELVETGKSLYPDISWERAPETRRPLSDFDKMAEMMSGLSLGYQRLAWLVAKYCNVLDDLDLKPLPDDFSNQPLEHEAVYQSFEDGVLYEPSEHESLDKLEQSSSEAPTNLEIELRDYFVLKSGERYPHRLSKDARDKIAEYCLAVDQHPAGVIMRAFGNWIDLLDAVHNEAFLQSRCNPANTATFGQLADQVYRALGFVEEERATGLVQVHQEAERVYERLQDLKKGEVRGLAMPLFNDAEDILTGLVSFHCRALDCLGDEYRKRLLKAMRASKSRTHGNYRSGKMQFGNKIDLLEQTNKLIEITPEYSAEFQRKFGTARRGIVDLTRWREILERIAIVRGAFAHPEVVIKSGDLEEIQGILEGLERQYFDRLEPRRNDRGDLVVRFDLRQLRILLQFALDSLLRFYEDLSENIYPEVQFHDQVEIRRDGSSWLIYTDEDGQTQHMLLGERQDFEGVFFPGRRVFFRYLDDGTPKWVPVQEQ